MHRYTQLPTSNTVGLIFTRVVDEGRYCCYLAAIHNAYRPCVTVPIAQPGVVVASIIMPASPCSCSCSCSLAVLDPRVGHTMDVLSPFIPVLCHSDWLFHGESCPRLDVVHPSRAWPSSPSCTWHCSLHYLFLQATPLFPHCVTIVC